MTDATHQLLSGALSGVASALILQPINVVKTVRQQGDAAASLRTPLRIFRDIGKLDGIQGLWRGTTATLVRNVPGVALYMTLLTQTRSYIATSPSFAAFHDRSSTWSLNTRSKRGSVLPTLTNTGNLLAGGTTRCAVGFLMNPFTVLKTQYESNMHEYKSFGSAVTSIFRAGHSELFRGFIATSVRDAPYAGLFLVAYEGVKTRASRVIEPKSNALTSLVHGVSAASAGIVATMVTHPFDVMKTRIQVRSEDKYRTLWKTTRTIWWQRGPAGFFDGVVLRLSRKVLSGAIGWAVYESVLRQLFDNHRPAATGDA